MITTQKIQIITEYIQKGVAKANAVAKKTNTNITRQQRGYADAAKTGKRHIESVRNNMMANSRAGQVMRMNAKDLGKYNETGRKFNTTGARTANKFRMMTHGARGFRMEMLGVMFFGMMLQRTFSGLIKTSLEWMGVTEIFSQVLGILFLPVAEWFLQIVLLLLKWVTSLTKAQKKWIGVIVLVGIALGVTLFILGTFALGIGSLILVLKGLTGWLGLALAGFLGFAGIMVLKDYLEDFGNASDEARTKLVAFGVSGEVFDMLRDKLIKLSNVIKNKLFGDEETGDIGLITKLKEKISMAINENKQTFIDWGVKIMRNLVTGAQKYFTDNPLVLIGAIVGGLAAGPLGASIGAAIGLGLGKIDFDQIQEVIDSGIGILNGILKGIGDNMDTIDKVMDTLLSAIGEWIGNHAEELADLGLQIAEAILKGLAKGLWNIGAGIGENIGENIIENVDNRFGEKGSIETLPSTLISSTSPSRFLSKENPNYNKGVTVSPTYNVNVSDRREFEEMLVENNRQLTEDVRRTIQV